MSLDAKGPKARPPKLRGAGQRVVDALSAWPDIIVNAHWNEYAPGAPDGVDFYVDRSGDTRGAAHNELGHVHLDGEAHLATPRTLGKALIAAGLAERFPYGGVGEWVLYSVHTQGEARHALWLFELVYGVLRGSSLESAIDAVAKRSERAGRSAAPLR